MSAQQNRSESRRPAAFLAGLRRKAGLDRAVSLTLFGSGWTTAAGGITILMIAHFLSPVQQGFYYTFSGFLASTILFELGLSYVILQFSSHERAKLEWAADGILIGDPGAKGRLALLLRMSLAWYGIIALLVVVTVLPAGLLFFHKHAPLGIAVTWQAPWVWMTLVGAATLAISPVLAVLEGCGMVADVAGVRAAQSVVGSLLLWSALSLHLGLFASPMPGMAILICSAWWLWRSKKKFLLDLLRLSRTAAQQAEVSFSWRQEVWPFQWRIAFSGISSYFIFQLFTPVLLATHGSIEAGRMGMSLTITGAVANLAQSWMTPKAKSFGTLIAEQNWRGLDRLFFPVLWRSWILAALGGFALWLACWFLYHQGYPISRRILPPLPLGLLVMTVVLNHAVIAEALYLRAHKQEPFLVLSLVTAGLVALCDVALGKPYGATGMMVGYLLVNLIVGLGGGTWVFVTKRRQWHLAAVVSN